MESKRLSYEELVYMANQGVTICGYVRNPHLNRTKKESKIEGICAITGEHCNDAKQNGYNCECYRRMNEKRMS